MINDCVAGYAGFIQSPQGSEWHQGDDTYTNDETDESMQQNNFDPNNLQFDLQQILGMVNNGPNDTNMDM